jgi:hypothetical protein
MPGVDGTIIKSFGSDLSPVQVTFNGVVYEDIKSFELSENGSFNWESSSNGMYKVSPEGLFSASEVTADWHYEHKPIFYKGAATAAEAKARAFQVLQEEPEPEDDGLGWRFA